MMTRENISCQTTTIYFLSRPLTKTLVLLLAALGLALPAQAQTPVVEATNADEATVLQVNDDGGLLGLGVFETGVIPAEGPGTRLMWYPAKAAFRAGRVGAVPVSDGSEWDEANVGAYSVALGRDTEASGDRSTALGGRTTASGAAATAMGGLTKASGFASTAMGFFTTASGQDAMAMGRQTTASGNQSTAMGFDTEATGSWSTAMGGRTTASGTASVAMGGGETTASGDFSMAMGISTTAGGDGSFAAGRRAVVRAEDDGTFTWADSEDADFTSTGEDQFLVRASGGVGLGTNSPLAQLHVAKAINAAASLTTHVALIENTSTGTNGDVLVLKSGASTPAASNNFITFLNGADDFVGAIDGNGSGGVVYRTSGGDFAERLPRLNIEETIAPGDVVGVVGGRITKQTAGAEQVLVVTDRPAVLGNAHLDESMSSPVAFVGQVPVRVRGPVSVGDWIVPSGRSDGTAVAITPEAMTLASHAQVIGRAWEASPGVGERRVTVAVGMDRAGALVEHLRRQEAQIKALRAENASTQERLAMLESQFQDDASALAGWSGWGAAGLLALLMLGGLLVRRRPGALLAAVLIAGLWAMPAAAQTPVVEVKNADEEAVLQVNEDGGLLGLGVFETGVIPAEGAGVRLMWHPAKAAFRAGRVGFAFASDGSEWDDANVGASSAAFGVDVTASGFASMAIGRSTVAGSNFSTAMGFQTTANGQASTAMGWQTTASGGASTAMGSQTTASGGASTAMGQGTTAQAYGSLAIGRFNVIDGNATTWVPTDPLFVAGNGSNNASRSNALTLFKDGNLTIAGNLTQSSDRRLKTGIVPLTGVLAALDGIEPVRYRFKDDTNRPAGEQLGLIAQQVQAAFPELVSRGADGYLSVAYPRLTAVLLQGLHEQQDRIGAQQTQIQALEARLAALEQSALEQGTPSHTLASVSGATGAGALLALLLVGGLALWRRRRPSTGSALPVALLMSAAGLAALDTTPAQAQTVSVQNGGALHIANGGVLDLHGSTLDLGDFGETARLEETAGGRVTGGLLTASRSLSAAPGAASGIDVAGLGLVFTADQALDAVTVTRGHAVQLGGQNPSIQRYYDLAPVPNGTQPESFDLTLRYADAELGPLPEGELELFYSADGGSTWRRRGFDDRDTDANTVTLEGIASVSAAEGRWTLGASSQPLPVELTTFEAALDGGAAVRLSWTTASETNNAGFHVERARDENNEDTDLAWQAVGFVEGNGTTSEARRYRFRDAALPFGAGRLRYRLRQVDLDGTTSFGPEVELTLDAPGRVALHAPYPNPLAGRATLRYELPQAGHIRLAVYNALGQRMALLAEGEQAAGRKEIALEAGRWPSGMYFVRLEVGGAAYTRKLTVIR